MMLREQQAAVLDEFKVRAGLSRPYGDRPRSVEIRSDRSATWKAGQERD
jgi:hypothetical protein